MEFQHVNVKIPVDGELHVDLDQIAIVFHRWISEQSRDELLVDVADYQHVPSGPGIVLVGHEADYALDNTGNQFGLRYNRKAAVAGSNTDRFQQALQSALEACVCLEGEFDVLKFSRNTFELSVNDRALAPNTDETWKAAEPEIKQFLSAVAGGDGFTINRQPDPRGRFGVTVSTSRPLDCSVD